MPLIDTSDTVGSVIKLKRKLEENRSEWKERFIENRRYYRGKQWTPEQEKLMEDANAKPLMTNDYYSAIRDKKGQTIRGKPLISAYPRDNDDINIANFYRDLISYILYINKYDIIEDKAVTDALVGGVGWIECLWNPLRDNRTGEVEILYQDALDVMWDPESKMPDFSDGEFVMKLLDMPLDQVILTWPDKKALFQTGKAWRPEASTRESGDYESNFEATDRAIIRDDRCEVVELWLKEYKTWAMLQYLGQDRDRGNEERVIWERVDDDEDLKAALADNPEYDLVEIQDHRMKIITVAGNVEVQNVYSEYAHNKFPLVPIVGIPTDTGYPTSQGEQVKQIQQISNMLYSLMVANLTSTNNPITILSKSLVHKDERKKIIEQGASPGSIWEVNSPISEAVHRIAGTPIDQSVQIVLQWLDGKIERMFGVRGSLRGEREPGVKSGKMLQMLISQASGSLSADTLPITAARRELGQLIVSNIQQFYTYERDIRIVGKTSEQAVKNEGAFPHDLKVGRFDVIVGDVTAQPTNKMEEFLFLLEINDVLARQGVQLPPSVLIKAAPLADRESVLAELKKQQMAQQQALAAGAGGAGAAPQAQ